MPALEAAASKTEKEEEPFGLGCALESFVEAEEILQLIDNLKVIVTQDLSTIERAYERFQFVLGQYFEQPHLLDSNLVTMLEKFIGIIKDPESTIELKHVVFKYMYVVVNVRDLKVIVRHLPHEVADFEPVLQLLEEQSPEDFDTWQTRYILLLWMSIIVMIPFELSRLDGNSKEEAQKKNVMTRVLDIIKTYTVVSDKCRDAAALLSSRFMTRLDVKEQHLAPYFDWTIKKSLGEDSNVFIKYGSLASVAMIFKHGKRNDLLPHARNLLQWAISPELKENTGANVNKMIYKVVQRIGLTFLPPRLASWSYRRGNRSLTANLSAGDGRIDSSVSLLEPMEVHENDDDIEVPDEVEEVIDQLIQGLGNIDSIVRWSAAKGVGRVTGRLPKDLGDEIVGSVLQLFNPREGDSSWHGGCLALAELGRRGLLLPSRLPEVVPVVIKALVYDEPRGYASVGSNIRDAACYVCWSFARAYEKDDLKPFVNEIATTLLIVACFDREINCRRAASAAFQENVGRQGTFPNGIDILTTADFFAVAARTNAYLNVSVFVGQFEDYTLPLIDHLVARKVDHWDVAIRELTAKALHNLTHLAIPHMIETVLPILFQKSNSIDLNNRHGGILAIGEILHAIAIELQKTNDPIAKLVPQYLIDSAKSLVPSFREKFYFRGLGGELMRLAVCDFIEKCSLAKMPFHNTDVIENWLVLLDECIPFNVLNIRTSAIKALPFFLNEYYSNPAHLEKQNTITKGFISHLSASHMESIRMGHALALGALPKFMLVPNVDNVIYALIETCKIKDSTSKWAESRRDSAKALTSIIVTLENDIGQVLTEKHIMDIYETFLEGLKDYTIDKRGDIGAWMREASLTGLQVIAVKLTNIKSPILKEEMVAAMMSRIAQQAVEKIDRTRAIAGKAFYSFLNNYHRVPYIPHYDELMEIFPKAVCDKLNWNSGSSTFPKFAKLIQFPEFTYHVLIGFVCSVGGLTETLVKHSSVALFGFISQQREQVGIHEAIRICETIHQIFLDNQKNDRITVPLFRFLDAIFDSGCIDPIFQDENSDFAQRILKLIQKEISGCRDIYKLMDGVGALCQFVQVKTEVCKIAVVQLCILLCHRHACIRRCAASKMYETLLVNDDNTQLLLENMEEYQQLLSDTNWEDSVEVVKPIRNKLCELLGVRVPVAVKKTVKTVS